MTLALVLAFVGTAVAGDRAVANVDAGTALADQPLRTLDGGETSLASFRGEVVVVNFWASWCKPCRKELPVMDGWHASWAGRGARVVAISIDKDVRNARRFADKAELSLTLLHDGPAGLARTLDLPSLPCTYLLDRQGKVVTVIRSSSSEDLAALHQSVESLLTAGGTQ